MNTKDAKMALSRGCGYAISKDILASNKQYGVSNYLPLFPTPVVFCEYIAIII